MSLDEIYSSYILIYNEEHGCFSQNKDLYEDYERLNEFYYNSFGHRLNIEDESNRDKLFRFANDCFRYKLLNDLMSMSVKMLINHGNYIEEDLYKRIDDILEIVDSTTKRLANYSKVKPIKLSSLSHEDLDKHFRDFLMIADPEGDYLKIYEDMLEKGNIVYIDELSDKEKEELSKKTPYTKKFNRFFYAGDDGVGKIYIERFGTIEDLSSIAHEFAHYVAYEKNKDYKNDPSIVVNEFPSTFYEILAFKYLANLGYPTEEIQNLNAQRFGFIYNSGIDLTLLNGYLRLFLANNYNITSEEDIAFRESNIENFVEKNGMDAFKDVVKNYPAFADPEYMAHEYCDAANASLYNNRHAYAMLYQYVLGNHLALENIKKLNSDTLKYMKQVTFNLTNINVEDLLNKNIGKAKRIKRD